MKKRNIMLVSAIVLATLLVVGGTMAWFTSNPDEVTNTFTAGTVKIEVKEHCFEDKINVNPGDIYEKEVSVKSKGSKQTYVRVKLTPQWTDKNNTVLPNEFNNEIIARYDIGEDWVLGPDGYYYYTKIMKENEETPLLIHEVEFNGPAMTDTYQGAKFTLDVKAEAVQASHYAFRDEWNITGAPLPTVPAPGVDPWVAD